MHINAISEAGRLKFQAEPDQQDIDFMEGRKGRIGRHEATIWLPETVGLSEIHPDAIALAALLIFGPFAARNITLGWNISPLFANACKDNFRRNIGPVSEDILPRMTNGASFEALAFSGGIDSVAALAIMPDTTIPIFMNRRIPEGIKQGMYKADAALKSCNSVSASGRKVIVVDTDMEFARSPVGFSVDWTNAIGGVLLCDFIGFRSVSFGMIEESAFFLGHDHYSDLAERSVYKAWAPMFQAIGVPIALPTAGLSEVMTSIIAQTVSDKWYAQSCVRGTEDQPCGRCFKCFRKTLLDARLSGTTVPAAHYDTARTSPEVKRRLLESPIHHENVLAFSLHGLSSEDHPIYSALLAKTAPINSYAKGLGILRRYNPSVMRYLPPHLQVQIKQSLSLFCEALTPQEQDIVEGWNLKSIVDSDKYKKAQENLKQELDKDAS